MGMHMCIQEYRMLHNGGIEYPAHCSLINFASKYGFTGSALGFEH